MQRIVVGTFRVSILVFSFLVFNIPLSLNAVELEVTGYSTLLVEYTDAKYTDNTTGLTENNVYEHDYADKYLNFTHQSRAGIQFNSKITEDFDFSLTLLMEGSDNYKARADWFYATYAANEDLHFRFGRLKVPFFMVSNYIDIGHAYPWVTPPQEVYSTNLIRSADGVELVYDTVTDGGTNLLFELYFGTSKDEDILSPAIINDPNVNPGVPNSADPPKYVLGDKVFFDADNLIGFEALIAHGGFTFRTGYYQALIDAKEFGISGEETSIASVGIIIDWHHFVLYSELVKRDSSEKADVLFADQTASYVTIGYRFSHVLPYMTGAKIDGDESSIHALRQTSIGAGIRFEINDSTDFKFEVINVKPKSNSGDIGAFGLFDHDTNGESANVYAMSLDFLF